MLLRRPPRPRASRQDPPPPSPLEVVLAYHATTKHHPYRYADSLGYLDWDTQPDPFRRYAGAALLPLDQVPPTPEPPYADLFHPGRIPPRPMDRASISQLFYDSLALSAWKEFQGSRWALRVNPSSGNLHPTEGYLLCGPVPGLLDRAAVCHYAPYEHGLEVRRTLSPSQWQALSGQLPPGAMLVGLASIYWRESWKYGERAFRYCQHDAGHAIAAIALAAAALGWQAVLLEGVADAELAVLLGLSEQLDEDGDADERVEAEHPDGLLALLPGGPAGAGVARRFGLPAGLLAELAETPPAGMPNRLSQGHQPWPAIEAVSAATERQAPPAAEFWQPAPAAPEGLAGAAGRAPARQLIRQRRSAVDMDGVTGLAREAFYALLQRLMPGRPPFTALPWRPAIHLALLVHRVQGVAPGLYILVREPAQREALAEALDANFAWQRPAGCPEGLDLYLLQQGDARRVAEAVSCNQEIAAAGAFAVSMVAEFAEPLARYGAWFYRRLHWEAGAIGQVLYLEAEAAGLRGTGIGCYFDDSMHQLLGLPGHATPGTPGLRYQDLYHFTVGGPVEDPRLRTAPAYGHLQHLL